MPGNVSIAEASQADIVKLNVNGVGKYILPTVVHYKVTW